MLLLELNKYWANQVKFSKILQKKGKGYQYCFGEYKGKFKSTWSYSSLFQPILVHSSLFQFSPAHSSPFQPIPAYCGIFQIISANSKRQMVWGRCQLVLGIPGDCDIPNLGVQTTKQTTPQVESLSIFSPSIEFGNGFFCVVSTAKRNWRRLFIAPELMQAAAAWSAARLRRTFGEVWYRCS